MPFLPPGTLSAQSFAHQSSRIWKESLGVATVSVAVWWAFILLRPDVFNSGSFLFRDYSQYLFNTDALLRGESLYRDVFWQYGPLPAWYHVLWARIGGNTPTVWALAQSLIQALNFGLIYSVLRQGFPARPVILAGVVTFIPLMLRWSMGLMYFGFESLFLLGALSLWAAPQSRTKRQALAAGVLLGMIQWAKFGSAFAAGAAMIVVDLLLLWRAGHLRSGIVAWVRLLLPTALGFALTEGALILWAFVMLPVPMARDLVLPLYMMKQYAFASTEASSILSQGAGVLVGTVVPACAGLLGGIVCLRDMMNQRSSRPALFGLLILVYFIIGWPLLFKHSWLLFQYSALLSVPAAVALILLRGKTRAGLLILSSCGALVVPYKMLVQHRPVHPVAMPNGQKLWLDDNETAAFKGILSALNGVPKSSQAGALLVLPWVGSGLHFFGGFPHASRYTLYLPGFLRDYDEPLLWRSLNQTGMIAVALPAEHAAKVNSDPGSWRVEDWSPFDAAHTALLRQRLGVPVKADRKWFVFPLRNESPMPEY